MRMEEVGDTSLFLVTKNPMIIKSNEIESKECEQMLQHSFNNKSNGAWSDLYPGHRGRSRKDGKWMCFNKY